MKILDPRSIIVILFYLAFNFMIIFFGLTIEPENHEIKKNITNFAPEYSQILKLEYFHLKNNFPQMSLNAEKMISKGEAFAEFDHPKGVYSSLKNGQDFFYQADSGQYQKKNELLQLINQVRLESDHSTYTADSVDYYPKRDIVIAQGKVKFNGIDKNTLDSIRIESHRMKANPESQTARFSGLVNGEIERKKKYEGKTKFSSDNLELDGNKSLARLIGNVRIQRENYDITAGNGDIYLENFNKSLKYFVLNDDVKVKEKIETEQGIQERRAFSERLEGFGREQKMILSGAPKVEMGKDVVKGYRITIRENVNMIEVDDAMSDMEVKRKKSKER